MIKKQRTVKKISVIEVVGMYDLPTEIHPHGNDYYEMHTSSYGTNNTKSQYEALISGKYVEIGICIVAQIVIKLESLKLSERLKILISWSKRLNRIAKSLEELVSQFIFNNPSSKIINIGSIEILKKKFFVEAELISTKPLADIEILSGTKVNTYLYYSPLGIGCGEDIEITANVNCYSIVERKKHTLNIILKQS